MTDLLRLNFFNEGISTLKGDFTCKRGIFVNLYSGTNGGSMYLDFQGSNILIERCHFIFSRAEIRGGAISIGVAKSLSVSKACFDSNVAKHGHDIYINTLLKYDLEVFSIEELSEVGGKASHGTIFGACESSNYKNSNMTTFEGSTAYYIHFNYAMIELSRILTIDLKTTEFFQMHHFYEKVFFKEIVSINSFSNFFSLDGQVEPILIEDSIFLFKETPNDIPETYNVQIIRSISNKEVKGFTYEVNPKIPQFEKIGCNERKINQSKCLNEKCHFLTLSFGLTSNTKRKR